MNIAQVKLLLWISAAAVGGVLGWIVYGFVQDFDTIAQPPSNETLLKAVDTVPDPPAPKVDLVDYTLVLASLKDLNWTGAPPPPPPPPPGPKDTEPVKPPVVPVADILSVLFVTQDTSRPERSFTFIEYKKPPLSGDPGTATLREGDPLPAPYADITVSRILALGVVFEFADEEREHESVGPPEFDLTTPIYVLGDGEEAIRPMTVEIGEMNTITWPEATQAVGRDHYLVGTEDMKRLGEDYSTILANEVRHARWKNPATGRYEGIEIKGLSKNAYAKQYGLSEGDVIKSINGEPVSSTAEAISFVKKTSKEKVVDKWYVVVSSKGKDRTVIVNTP